jgi:uncharacterized membrane protein
MRIVLGVIGAVLGLSLASESVGFYGAVFGAVAGLLLAEAVHARTRLTRLEKQLNSLEASPPVARESRPVTPYYDTDSPYNQTGTRAAETAPAETPERTQTAAPPPKPTPPPESPPWREFEPRPAPAAQPSEQPWPERTEYVSPASAASEEPALVRVVREYFTGGNTVVRVGVIILFIGMAFLLRYVAEHTNVPIEFRLSGVALAGVVLLALGWRLRLKRPGYALALQGGAIGILYLTVFSSMRLFHVLPPGPAFLVLVVISVLCAALAVLQNSLAFALLATGCGFLSPILASTGQGNHVVLFSYYLILNLGILSIAWFKAWRPLNVVGFLFTFIIGTAWGVLRYKRELLGSTEPFLIAFFVLYVAIAVLFSLRQRPELRGYVDGTLVFGVPVVAFGLQSALVRHIPFAMAYSAVAVSALYLVLAWLLHRGKRETQRLLIEAFMALGVVFATLAVPLALDGHWSAATWALEGAALVWVGCRQGRRLPRAFGALLQIAGGVIFLFSSEAYSATPLLNSAYLGGVMIAVASVFACYTLQKAHEQLSSYESAFGPILFFWGAIWWLASGLMEMDGHPPTPYSESNILVFLTASALLSSELHRRLSIGAAQLPPFALLPVMILFAAISILASVDHPLGQGGWAAWPIAFAGFYFWLRRIEGQETLSRGLHVVSALLLLSLLSWEVAWQIDEAVKGGGSWPAIAWALVPALALVSLPALGMRVSWPFSAHKDAYVVGVGSVLAAFLALWSLATNLTMPGDPFPLPFIPLLNPLDVAQAFVLLVLTRYVIHLHKTDPPVLSDVDLPRVVWTLAILLFVWLNAVLLRTLHHWQGVPYEPEALFRSTLVQTSITIFWTVLALATMLIATRKAARLVWIVGAVLIAVVIAKLFLIDLSRIGTVERIVSFIGVGVLMLVVGYFSPLPPARREATA